MSNKQPARAAATTKQAKPEVKEQPKPTAKTPQAASKPTPTVPGFDPSKYVKQGLSAEDVIRIKECFDVFDYDRSGSIT